MSRLALRVTLFILARVVVLAAWSKLRHTDKPIYDAPGRYKLEEHPALRRVN